MYCHLQCDEVLCIVDRWEPSQGVKREGEREEERKSETNFFERERAIQLGRFMVLYFLK